VKLYIENSNYEFRSGESINKINAFIAINNSRRERIAQGLPRIKRIARSFNMPVDFHSYPAMAVGGPVVPVNLFEAILNDDGHEPMPNQRKLDVLNQTIGACKELEQKELHQLINPLFWLNLLVRTVLRTPFWILETAGFKLESFEKSLAGKLIRFAEILGIISLLIYIGFTDSELKEIVRNLVK